MVSERVRKLIERIDKKNNRGEIIIDGKRLKHILMNEINEEEAEFLSELINTLFIMEEDFEEFGVK